MRKMMAITSALFLSLATTATAFTGPGAGEPDCDLNAGCFWVPYDVETGEGGYWECAPPPVEMECVE